MWRSIVPLLLLLGAVPVHPVTVQEIPNPRPAGWSVDLTGRIPSATLQEIDQLGDEVKAKTGSEIAVVVVGSLNGAASRNFAVRLFNAWRIGDPARKNGVLIFTALDDHKAEVVLGSGIDNAQTRRTSDEIMQSEMVPRFRAGDPAAAVLAGAREHARRILGVEMTAAPAPNSAPQPPQKAVSQPAREPVPSPGGIWIVIVLLMFASVLAV
ncbi:MAG TPA: TPM domain-containing protein, partial [Thermoanaerobaculia bacterium]